MYIRTMDRTAPGIFQYRLGEPATPAREAEQRFKRVAALVTDGLNMAKAATPQLKTQAQQDLLRFMTSLLDNFFPAGDGLIDAQGTVLRQSQKATIQINVRANDGSLWPFEHRFPAVPCGSYSRSSDSRRAYDGHLQHHASVYTRDERRVTA